MYGRSTLAVDPVVVVELNRLTTKITGGSSSDTGSIFDDLGVNFNSARVFYAIPFVG